MRAFPSRVFLSFGMAVASVWMFGCGGASNSASEPSQNGGNPVSNVQPITVNAGPDFNYVDGAFTSVTICVPGSATNCQTIDGILVDTGSFGLRILSSALTVSLPQQTDTGGNPIAECAAFATTFAWGPVQTADVKIAGEQASSLPIQVLGSPNFSTMSSICSPPKMLIDDLASLGANGLLGVGQSIPDLQTYYACPSSGCSVTNEGLAQQVQNPVASFATDNNGVIVELPAVSGAEATVSGSLIFGIGTQSNNGLGGATVFGTDPFGNFNTTYQSTEYESFLDSGSNGIYFLGSTTTGLPVCPEIIFKYLYCPASTQTISVVNDGTNGASGTVSFTVGNGETLESNANDTAINGLAGPQVGMFDFGLPFFFGKNVYVAIDGKSTPAGNGPFTAY